MGFKMTVIDNVNTVKLARNYKDNDALWLFGAQTWYKLLEPWTPMDQGTLFKSVLIEPKKIYYIVPYAKYVYYGEKMNFQTQHHEKATHHWDDAAAPTQLPKLVEAMQNYIDTKMKAR